MTAATFVEPEGEWIAVSHNGEVLSFRAATVTASKKSRTWKGARIVGLIAGAQVTGNKAFALTARGMAQPLALPDILARGKTARAAHEPIALAEGDMVVSLCYLAE